MGFRIPLAEEFNPSTFEQDGVARVVFLRDDVLQEPRLVVRKIPAVDSIGETLDEWGGAWPDSKELSRQKSRPVVGIGSDGLAERLWIAPFPDLLPELQLMLEHRIFRSGDHFFVFTWQQEASDSLAIQEWNRLSAGIEFIDLPSVKQ
jgi:hypothetical protein